jgi:hypothetical protein
MTAAVIIPQYIINIIVKTGADFNEKYSIYSWG